jgi:pyridoxine kinase
MEAGAVAKSRDAMQILSLQSRVAYGHVGNSTAVPALQRLGHQVWPVDTTLLSNHLGYAIHSGRILPMAEVADVAEGLGKLGLFGRLDAVLTGFLGKAAPVAAGIVTRIRAENPAALYCLDPVMGERDGGFYVARETADTIARGLVPEADILLPNAFELDHLAGSRTTSLSDVIDAAETLRRQARPGAMVIATGLDRQDGPQGCVEVLAVGADGRWLASSPRLDLPAHGAGDLFAALFLGHYLNRRDLPRALTKAMDSTHAVFVRSIGQEELALVASLDVLADPPKTAEIEKIS